LRRGSLRWQIARLDGFEVGVFHACRLQLGALASLLGDLGR
jgi:hypothetical protein